MITTPKQATEWLLNHKLVCRVITDVPADKAVFGLLEEYAPNLEVYLYNAASLPNPTIRAEFPYIPLRRALEDICRLCGCVVEVNDRGILVIRSELVEEQMKRALRVEELHLVKGERNG